MLDWRALPDRANADSEFRLAARAWTATLRLDVGGASVALRIENGVLTRVEQVSAGAACDVYVQASEGVWRELLAPVPRPYYQDLTGAQIHHGLQLPADPLCYAAYYPALRRLVQLMSALVR